MIDFVKIQIYGLPAEDYLNNTMLDFHYSVSQKTGEIESKSIAEFGGLKAIINKNYLCIQGSMHKFQLGNNIGDYNYQALLETIIDLYQRFQINPFTCVLRNVEFGVNIDPQIPTSKVLDSILNYKGKFPSIRTFNDAGFMVQFEFNQYYLKIYDKGFQNNLLDKILRFEIKVIKMEYLRKYGVKYLIDLLNPTILGLLGAHLASVFNDILIFDTSIDTLDLKVSERLKLKDYFNPKYWSKLKPKNFHYHKGKLKEMTNQLTNNFQENIGKLIENKWAELMLSDYSTTQKKNMFIKELQGWTSKIDPSDSSTILPVPTRCKITGKDISDQRAGSKFQSEGKVGYKEAHRIRNLDSNPRNRLRYKLESIKKHPTLFSLDEMIVLSKEQEELLKFWNGSKYELRINILRDK